MSPELGQIIFGGYGQIDMSEIGDAAVSHLLAEIERVYWNINQETWDARWGGVDPRIPGIVWNGYRYPEEIPEDVETDGTGIPPGIVVEGHERVGVRWYKYPGRGMATQIEMSPQDWSKWLNDGLRFVRIHESRHDNFETSHELAKYGFDWPPPRRKP